MAGKQTIGEIDFSEFVRCPLRTGELAYAESPELEAGKETVRWLLQLAFNGTLPLLAQVRERYEHELDHLLRSGVIKRTYHQNRLNNVVRYSKVLHDLAVEYLVMSPVTAYDLPFGRNTVRGEYAVLTKPKRSHEPFILRLRLDMDNRVEESKGQDVVNMLRWAHFRQWEVTHPQVRVLNYCLDGGRGWEEFYNEAVVRGYLNNISSQLVDKKVYPNPGSHCEACLSHRCETEAKLEFQSHG